MIALAGLLERLRHCPSVHRPLVLAQCRDATLRAVLCGEIKPRSVGLAVLRDLAAERTDKALFDLSQDFLGDFVETLALIWPARPTNAPTPELGTVLAELAVAAKADIPHLLAGWLDASDAATRLTLLRLITGKLRPVLEATPAVAGAAGAVIAMLMYAQSVRVGLEREYSFGVWRDDATLVPVARIMVAERDALEAWVQARTVAKFGPVREVAPGLAVELAFTGVVAAPRHKAGLALHEARVVRVFAGAEVGRLTDLRALLD